MHRPRQLLARLCRSALECSECLCFSISGIYLWARIVGLINACEEALEPCLKKGSAQRYILHICKDILMGSRRVMPSRVLGMCWLSYEQS